MNSLIQAPVPTENYHQPSDDQDILFALGNKNAELNVCQAVVNLHSQPPEIGLVVDGSTHSEIIP